MNHTAADLDVSNRAMVTSIRNSNPAFRTQQRPVFVPFPRFGTHRMIEQANSYHAIYDKPWLRWKIPEQPPPDLDMTPLE